jgi:hypothetical protein
VSFCRWTFVLALSLAILLLAACGGRQPTPVAETAVQTATVEVTPSPEPSVTPTEYTGLCAYVWANQLLTAETIALSQAVRAAGLTEVEAQATAYGENCVDMSSNAVISFSAQQTDFFFDVAVSDASDTQVLGQWVVVVFDILKNFQPGVVPGVNPGRVEIVFQDGKRIEAIAISQTRGRELIARGLRGSALYEAVLREQ